MSDAKYKSTSELTWLDIPIGKRSPELQKHLDSTKERTGYVRNGQIVLGVAEDLIFGVDGLAAAVLREDAGGLSPKERELLALVVSSANNCVGCMFSHSAFLRVISKDPFWTDVVQANYRHAELTARERALADYAYKLTKFPNEIDKSDLHALRKHQLTDLDIMYVVAIVAYFNMSNRLMSGLGMKPNKEVHEMGR